MDSVRSRTTTPSPTGPVRTCVGCRARDLRSELLRLVLPTSGDRSAVVVDVRGTLPGRGAWIHPVPACLDLAERRRAVGRALRADGPVSLTRVRDHLEGQDR
nr:YlxR family protein [Isoptericola dokdonensis]